MEKKFGFAGRILVFFLSHYIYNMLLILLALPGFFLKEFAYIQMSFYILVVLKNGADYIIYFSPEYKEKLKDLDKLEETLQTDSKADSK